MVQSSSPSSYDLGRDGVSSLRLTAQHYVVRQKFGWLVHPEIKAALESSSSPQILDLATGNGVWAAEVAEELPSSEVTALDVSTEQFPPSWSWPRNVQFAKYDVFEDVPQEYRNRFDVVHVRLLLSHTPKDKGPMLLDRFKTFLKPGGYLQWTEGDPPILEKVSPSDGEVGLQVEPFTSFHALNPQLVTKVEFFTNIEGELQKAGFANTKKLKPRTCAYLMKHDSDNLVSGCVEIYNGLLESGKCPPEMLDRFRKLLEELQFEIGRGTLFNYITSVAIGKKIQ